MPIGNCAAVPSVVRHLILERPSSVLDLGMGFGMHGAMVRQWVDEGVQPWRTRIVGVEVWGAYRNPVWDLYNVVFVQTIQHYLQFHAEPYECIILGDVIEHFEKAEGLALLARLQSLLTVGGTIIVITPAHFVPQGITHGNEYEQHRSLWTTDEFRSLGYEMLLNEDDPQVGFDVALVAIWRQI